MSPPLNTNNKFIKYTSSPLPENYVHTYYRPALTPDSIIVDLGAHQGGFAQIMIDLYGCTYHCVEALPQNYELIPGTPGLHA